MTEKKLNICIIAREYPPETLWGGIGTFTYNLAHGLNEIGHRVDVLAFTFGSESTIDDNGVTIHRIPSPKLPFSRKSYWDLVGSALFPFAFLYSYKIRNKINDLSVNRKYDVLDFPEHIGEGFFTILSNRYPSLVRLYTPLSLIGELGLNRSTNKVDYFLFGLMEKYSIKKGTIVNSPSKALATLVGKKFKIKRTIDLIYNPIDTSKFLPKDGRQIGDKIKVLFIGRLSDRKGVHVLARAIPKVLKINSNFEFTIIGGDDKGVDGFESMKDFMNNIFDKNGVTNCVILKGVVPYEELPNVYNNADISVVPSLYDNSPYTCLEAMSCGLPVISTSSGGMPEYIDDNVNGKIVPPGDIDALAAAILWFAKDTGRIVEFGNRAREKSILEFRRGAVAGKISKLYQESIHLHGKGERKTIAADLESSE
jgi:glycosyltransferase involved in cell wall biosynthesis